MQALVFLTIKYLSNRLVTNINSYSKKFLLFPRELFFCESNFPTF
ncbi:cellulose biosynthesis protein BcsF [Brochothrix thermosphacta]